MTNNLLSLLKTEFLNRFRLGTIRNERNKKVKYRYIAMGVLYIFLAIVLAGLLLWNFIWLQLSWDVLCGSWLCTYDYLYCYFVFHIFKNQWNSF